MHSTSCQKLLQGCLCLKMERDEYSVTTTLLPLPISGLTAGQVHGMLHLVQPYQQTANRQPPRPPACLPACLLCLPACFPACLPACSQQPAAIRLTSKPAAASQPAAGSQQPAGSSPLRDRQRDRKRSENYPKHVPSSSMACYIWLSPIRYPQKGRLRC